MTAAFPSRQQAAMAAQEAAQAYGANDFARAEQLFAEASRLDPVTSSYRCNLATARLALGKAEYARGELERSLDPLDPLDCATLGLVLMTLKAQAEAMVWLRRALLLDPRQVQARLNLANLLCAEDRQTEAATLLRLGLAEMPQQWQLLNNLGVVLHEQGELSEALACYDQALARQPAQPAIELNRAHTLLLMGRWRDGFAAYESRHLYIPPSKAPRWRGESITDKTLLVMAEQGLGDAIQFARLLPLAKAKCRRLILSCDRSLHRLFEGICDLADEAAPLPGHDLQCPLLSLPHVLGLDAPGLFGTVPYLSVAEPFALEGTFKLGFVWAGRAGHANDKNRSIDPALLAPLLNLPGVAAYSLQIGKGEPPAGMTHLAPIFTDLYDTARAVAALDLLVSVDTAPAHLAGALGKPVWTLLPFTPDWRWGLKKDNTPWYPSMRLFRQATPGDWTAVIGKMVTELGAQRLGH